MSMFPIISSNIRGIDHKPSAAGGTLFVWFNKGAAWAYDGVSEAIYQQFRTSPSAGRFYADHIKGKYEGRKLAE